MPDSSNVFTDIKISELPAANQANDSDQLEANQSGTTRRITVAQLRSGGTGPLVNARDHGAVGDGVADDTAAIQAALNTGRATFLPKGDYKITNMLTIPHGSGLFGETKHLSRLIIPLTFNLSASGVLWVTQPSDFFDGQAVTIRDLTFDFDQPDTAVRASLMHYPPAVFMPNANRVVIGNIRIIRGWNGLWMDSTTPSGSTGGCWIDLLEASCFNKAIYMDDALDVMHVSRIHLWDFGLTTNQQTVWKDGNTIGLEAGRVDVLHLGDFFAINLPKAIWLRSGARNWPGLSFGQLTNIMLDNAGMVIENGTWNIANLYLAPGSYTARSLIVAADSSQGAIANISSLYQRILLAHASSPTETILVDGVAGASHLNITGMTSTMYVTDVDVSHVACNQSGAHVASLSIAGGRFARFDGTSPTRPTIDIRGGRASLTNITGSDKATGTGNLIRVTVDNWVLINNVTTLGWGISLPANARLIDHDTYPVRQTWTPTVTAQTGTFTSVTGAGRYTLHGKFLKLEVLVSIVTNGTAATGVVVTLPPSFTSAACWQVIPGREVSSSGAMLQTVIAPSSTFMVINKYDNTYPGANGFNLAITGEIEIA